MWWDLPLLTLKKTQISISFYIYTALSLQSITPESFMQSVAFTAHCTFPPRQHKHPKYMQQYNCTQSAKKHHLKNKRRETSTCSLFKSFIAHTKYKYKADTPCTWQEKKTPCAFTGDCYKLTREISPGDDSTDLKLHTAIYNCSTASKIIAFRKLLHCCFTDTE